MGKSRNIHGTWYGYCRMDLGVELGINASLCQQAYGVILLVFKTSSGWTILKNPQGCKLGKDVLLGSYVGVKVFLVVKM